MKRKSLLLAILLLSIKAGLLAQSVNTKNGNFYISYTDVFVKGHPLGLSIDRTYNSKSTQKGWFGMGWSSYFESYIAPIPGGGIVLNHFGDGSKEIFRPAQWNTQDISAAVNKLVEVAQKRLEITTPEEIAALKDKLLNDEDVRINKWISCVKEGAIEVNLPTPGIKLSSEWGGSSFIEVVDNGYKKASDEGKMEYFDARGRFSRITDSSGNEIIFHYTDRSTPNTIEDNKGNVFTLTFNAQNLLEQVRVRYANGKKDSASFTYNNNTNTLNSSTGTEKNLYRFEWDQNYNLTRIVYADNTDTRITYNDETNWASSIKMKDGSKILYEYPQLSENEYGTTTTYFDSTGKKTSRISQWYVIRTNEIGKQWEYKRIIVQDEDSVTYINSERFGHADTVFVNNGVYFTYKYDKKGQLSLINRNGSLHATVFTEDEKLVKFTTPENTYRAVYKGDEIEKLLGSDGTEVLLPVKEKGTETSPIRIKIQALLRPFKFTLFWYELHLRD